MPAAYDSVLCALLPDGTRSRCLRGGCSGCGGGGACGQCYLASWAEIMKRSQDHMTGLIRVMCYVFNGN
jgi:hypothetical protein